MKSLRSFILVCAFLVYAPLVTAADTVQGTGTVAETMTSGGYVYIRMQEQDVWIAANTFAVSKGDKVNYSGGMEMKGFHSKSLDRTFESIFFVSGASLAGEAGGASTAATMEGHGGKNTPMQKPKSAQSPAPGEIKPLKEGKTVAAIFADSADLNEQVVSLNARVIKINKAIMGRNWITLQDGTGTEPDNKILATSQEVVAVGDVVIAKGTVVTDMDLGYGYKYKVLLEEASFSAGVE